MRKRNWNTYAMSGYTRDVANDQQSAGGCHFYEVKKGPSGWIKRIRQSNGKFRAYGPVTAISEREGEEYFERAETY